MGIKINYNGVIYKVDVGVRVNNVIFWYWKILIYIDVYEVKNKNFLMGRY